MESTQQANVFSRSKIMVGVSGGIAAYKVAELIRLLKKAGAEINVAMTEDAERFITPLTLGALAESEVLTEIFPENSRGSWTKHVELGLWADVFVIAPATAQTIAKLATGFCDNMLTATALAARCPILVCPAMDHDMYVHAATTQNIAKLISFGYDVMPPAYGSLASGLVGQGRLPEPAQIVERLEALLAGRETALDAALDGKRVLVTAGPTRESVDPVRFLSNRSTGTMGYEVARAAAQAGAQVTLVSGPTHLAAPANVERLWVETAAEMHDAVMARRTADIIVMAAAVSDFRPAVQSPHKIKKQDADDSLPLERTADILAELGKQKTPGQVLIGFALETNDGLSNAQAKLHLKNLDLIVLNNPTEEGAGFGTSTNRVALISADGSIEELPLMSKRALASRLVRRILDKPRSQKVH